MTQLLQAALNGSPMTIEKLSDVGDAAMSEFEGSDAAKRRRWRSLRVEKV
jgi:hypothetical protein